MLDDENTIKQFDVSDALGSASVQFEQVLFDCQISNLSAISTDIENIIISSIGGSALSATITTSWIRNDLKTPIEIIRTYDLPLYVSDKSLVIAHSYSGNTEESISFLAQAKLRNSKIAVIASGGKLIEIAKENGYPYIIIPSVPQPRMAVINQLCAIVKTLVGFGLLNQEKLDEIAETNEWLRAETEKWASDIPVRLNLAKKIAMRSAGKTAIFYGGGITAPVAYKWKISWNETSKNTAFWNELPEANHNEFIGWTSHPVEKPFAVFDLVSNLEHQQVLKRFEITDKLLSGFRPNSMTIDLAGTTEIQQLLWGIILADFASIYLAVLNGIDPTPVELVNKLKSELVK